MAGKKSSGAYEAILRDVFMARYVDGASEVPFTREDLREVDRRLATGVSNIGDVPYSYRYRRPMPEEIARRAPTGKVWVIRGVGGARYCFAAVDPDQELTPDPMLAATDIPDATPGIIARYALSDEQALLARVRYNRLVDVFTGVACYSLQSHLRTNVPGIGQVETDEIYVGLDCHGAHYVFPVQAKAGRDRLGVVQIEQDFALCAYKFAGLICRPIAAQFVGDRIALFALVETGDGIRKLDERHYRLLPQEQISDEALAAYRAQAGCTPPA